MRIERTPRGFFCVVHPAYAGKNEGEEIRVIQESSAIGDYEDSMVKPGSSFLWVGENVHLNREEVEQLVGLMNFWLKTGRLG